MSWRMPRRMTMGGGGQPGMLRSTGRCFSSAPPVA